MRVRISYSVELDDVPNECARMLEEAKQHIDEVTATVENLVDQLEERRAIGWQVKSRIESCRQELAKLDTILADNDMILQGYFAAKEQQEQPEQSEVSDVSEG
jgi:predicted nuclease with TOPRIM domain